MKYKFKKSDFNFFSNTFLFLFFQRLIGVVPFLIRGRRKKNQNVVRKNVWIALYYSYIYTNCRRISARHKWISHCHGVKWMSSFYKWCQINSAEHWISVRLCNIHIAHTYSKWTHAFLYKCLLFSSSAYIHTNSNKSLCREDDCYFFFLFFSFWPKTFRFPSFISIFPIQHGLQ